MKKALVVFHSVCSSVYLMAKEYEKALQSCGIETDLFRVAGTEDESTAASYSISEECKAKIAAVPAIDSVDKLPEYDYVFIGTPVYLGNVSNAVKSFVEKFTKFWANSDLYGKPFGSFASCSGWQGGGDICLQALNVSMMHMGLIPIPVAVVNKGATQPAYGILHNAGEDNTPPSEDTLLAIRDYVERMVKLF